ncbi:hypothetical protein DWB67_10895 [Paracoccus sp. JM45]|nr:hypothetical protein DWB67_10895 [Paracoccus sp. JM45]
MVSEPSAYRILKVADLITASGYAVIRSADAFTVKTTIINKTCPSDFTYFQDHWVGLVLSQRYSG